MVRQALFAVILEIPNEIAVPVELLDSTARGWTLETRLAIDGLGGAKEVAVVEQVSRGSAGMFARPRVNDATFVVI